MRKYRINFELKYTHDVYVTAKNTQIAKLKGIIKFFKILKESMFNINIEET